LEARSKSLTESAKKKFVAEKKNRVWAKKDRYGKGCGWGEKVFVHNALIGKKTRRGVPGGRSGKTPLLSGEKKRAASNRGRVKKEKLLPRRER